MAGRPIVFWYFNIFSETMCAIGLLQYKYVPYKTSIIHVGNYFVVLQNQWTKWKQIWLQCSLNGLIQNNFFRVCVDQNSKMAAIVGHSFIITYGKKWRFLFLFLNCKAKKKCMCVYCHMSKKSRVGRSALIFILFFFFFFELLAKLEIDVPGSGIRFRYFVFEISDKPSFVLWRVTVFLPSLLSISTKS